MSRNHPAIVESTMTRMFGPPEPLTAPRPLMRAIIVDTSDDDVVAMTRALEHSGFIVQVCRVDTVEDLREALDDPCDIVFSDYAPPRLDVMTALDVLRDQANDIPLLLVSRNVDHRAALSALRAGARDYVHKDELEILAPVAERALESVAERRRLEDELRQAQKMEAVGRLAGGVAHDLNNVLTVIQSFGELVMDDTDPNSPSHECLGQILDAAARARRLTRQLLAFSRRQTVDPRVVTFNEIAADTDKLLRPVIGEDIEVEIRLAKDAWPIKVDPGHFEQVLVNLAVNARDAMPRGGVLTIETDNVVLDQRWAKVHGVRLESGEYAMLAVSDTGIGISPAMQQRIFEPFFTTKDKSKGTGLGLSTCYGIVKQAGGYIWVYSEEGLGTTFKLYVPRTSEATAHNSRPQVPIPRLDGNETVLVVEDDRQVRCLIVDALRRLGYTVYMAENGLDALSVIETHCDEIDVLLSDVVMPRMGGKELADRLCRIRPEIRVLFMSGYTGDALAPHGVLDPSTVLLEKPFTPLQLAQKLRSVIEASSSRA